MKLTCTTCKGAETEVRVVHEYNADLLGAPFPVYLVDAVKQHVCIKCDKATKTVIPDLDGLLHVIAQTRAVIPRKLSGPEIKFLRRAVGCKAKHFAQKIEMTPENLSRVEKGMKPLGPQSEKLLRFYVLTKLMDDDLVSKITKEELNKVFDIKIETFWDPNNPLVLRFVRESRDASEPGDAEGNKRYQLQPMSQAA
jgi:transcriptional regulator with XRE-family HTH domain